MYDDMLGALEGADVRARRARSIAPARRRRKTFRRCGWRGDLSRRFRRSKRFACANLSDATRSVVQAVTVLRA